MIRVARPTFCLVLLLLAAARVAVAAEGRLTGKVLDEYNALPLPGAPVEIEPIGAVVYTSLDGRYDVAVPPGAYLVKVSFSGYKPRAVERVQVESGRTVTVDFPLQFETVALKEELTVTAEASPASSSQVAVLLERQRAGSISEALARDEMGRNADSDAASAMQRVTGVSVVDGQYVFVRGLGERYSNTTLNGAALPTTEPDKRVVPLDLFPTGLVESVRVTKSYLPDKPGEFAGGLVEIEPINFPAQRTFTMSISGGANSLTTGKDIQDYPGGGFDFLGFDDGGRGLPGLIPGEKVVQRGVFGGGFDQGDLTAFGRAFSNVWEPRDATGAADSSFSVLAGDSWDRLGAVVSLSYNRKVRYREERQQYYALGAGDALRRTNDFAFRYSTDRAMLGAVANLAWRVSGNHRLAFENFFSNSGRDEVRTFSGYQEDKGVELRNARLFFVQEQIFSSKLSGEHFFQGLASSRIDWRTTFSRARRDEPDLRETLYQFNPSQGTFELANESQSGLRMFNEQEDYAYQGEADWSFVFTGFGGRHGQVKSGASYIFRERDFSSRRFRLKPTRARVIDLTRSPETLFAPGTVGVDFFLEEDTRRTDAYDAEQTVLAGYAMVDLPLTGRLRLVGGARVESSDQRVITRDLFDPTLPRIRSGLQDTDVLPGVNLVYALRDSMNLRAAVSQTVNRPEFRELAPFEFTDIVGGRAVVGNPDLRRALVRNADLRWEWFPRGGGDAEVVAASLFFKDFVEPIERVVEATAQFRTSYANAKGARNYGLELEARKAVGAHFLLGANYTHVRSRIELFRGAGQIQTSLDRPLAGQAGHVLNGMLEWRSRDGLLSARALVNWFDERISDVGALGIPDVIEEGRAALDLVVTRRMGPLTVRLNGENLTDAEELYTQGGERQRAFRTGRSLSLGLSYTP